MSNFNPRSPRGERPLDIIILRKHCLFQSTLPTRGATSEFTRRCRFVYISIHAPHAGSDPIAVVTDADVNISIHAPHAGSDSLSSRVILAMRLFQSTLPTRGATRRRRQDRRRVGISIHAPHAGSDHGLPDFDTCNSAFQSTLPTRGATRLQRVMQRVRAISIHAPHAGSDYCGHKYSPNINHFNPRSPRGERLTVAKFNNSSRHFNPRSPRGERLTGLTANHTGIIFQSTLPTRGATLRA